MAHPEIRLAILGATGGIGSHLLTWALDAGHPVHALARSPEALPARAGLTVTRGDALDETAVTEVIAGADAVLSALGPRGAKAPGLLAGAASNTVSAMRKTGARRLICVSAAGAYITGDPNMNRLVKLILPRVFAKLHPRSRAPWVTILVCATGWAMCLGLGFERLVIIDILLYGVSLSLEFVALIVLRIREPELPRPFRVPGGLFGVIAIGIPPMLLLGFSIIRSEHEQIWNMSSFAFGMILIAAGCVAYLINHALKPQGWAIREEKPQPSS